MNQKDTDILLSKMTEERLLSKMDSLFVKMEQRMMKEMERIIDEKMDEMERRIEEKMDKMERRLEEKMDNIFNNHQIQFNGAKREMQQIRGQVHEHEKNLLTITREQNQLDDNLASTTYRQGLCVELTIREANTILTHTCNIGVKLIEAKEDGNQFFKLFAIATDALNILISMVFLLKNYTKYASVDAIKSTVVKVRWFRTSRVTNLFWHQQY